ncbi:MAG: type II toxin-antitoxin system RelB/DinJ family antitoxin [Coriobacteriales bacterium]|jgi:DNA-damage-inducible protein J|nr:type II toxin-antitoxin system RelB/DinJ family antitoxin [Coriobacteriales bacterium]
MATVNVRIDDKLKHDAETVLSDIGLSLSSAITIYFKQVVRERAVPFPLRASDSLLEPTPEFARTLKEVEEDILNNRNLSTTASDADLLDHLKGLRSAV